MTIIGAAALNEIPDNVRDENTGDMKSAELIKTEDEKFGKNEYLESAESVKEQENSEEMNSVIEDFLEVESELAYDLDYEAEDESNNIVDDF